MDRVVGPKANYRWSDGRANSSELCTPRADYSIQGDSAMETVVTGLSQPTHTAAPDTARDTATSQQPTLNQFFSAAEARIDRWRTLNRIAKGLAASAQQSEGLRIEPVGQRRDGLRQQLDTVLEEITPLEE